MNPGKSGPESQCVACTQQTLCPCPACGSPLTDHSAVCPHCKQPLSWRGIYPRSNSLDFLDCPASNQSLRDEATYELTIEFLQPELARRLIGRHNASITNAQNKTLASRSPIVLRSLRSLTPELAGELRHALGNIHLPDLTKLSSEAALRFSAHTAALHLDGLTELDASVANSLAKHPGRLSFGSLTSLSEETAAALSQHAGPLALHGLKCVDESTARALSRHRGRLELDRLDEDLTPPCLQARLYSNHAELRNFTAGLTNLTPQFAKMLLASCGDASLILDGLTHLDADLAKELAAGEMCLLSLNGLRELSDKAAAALGQFPGHIRLNGIDRITNNQMHLLTRSPTPPRQISLRKLSQLPTGWFPKKGGGQWDLHLYGLSVNSLDSARRLADFPGKLHVDRGNWMTVEVLEVFQDGSSKLVIHDVPSVPPAVRKRIENSSDGQVCFPPAKSELEDILDRIRERRAARAAAHETIDLREATRLTQSAATVLATWPGELIFHEDTYLTGNVASELAAHKGTLHFKKQSELRVDTLKLLVNHTGKIVMYGNYEIPNQAIDMLVQKKMGNILLDPICAMSLAPAQQAKLSTNPNVQFRFQSGFNGG